MSVAERRRVGLKSTAEPFNDNEEAVRRMGAAIGSERLRHAILTTMGVDPGPFMLPAPVVIEAAPQPAPKHVEPRDPYSPVARIQAVVANHYRIAPLHMKSAQRGRDIARPRQVAMYLVAELTPLSLVNIGRMFGGRDHTTVLHAIRRVAELMDTDPGLAADVATLREALAA